MICFLCINIVTVTCVRAFFVVRSRLTGGLLFFPFCQNKQRSPPKISWSGSVQQNTTQTTLDYTQTPYTGVWSTNMSHFSPLLSFQVCRLLIKFKSCPKCMLGETTHYSGLLRSRLVWIFGCSQGLAEGSRHDSCSLSPSAFKLFGEPIFPAL